MLIALDTSVLIALLDREDRWHPQAAALHEALVARAYDIVIFDCVLAETISTLARRLHEGRREGSLDVILDALQASYPLDAVEWLFPDVPSIVRGGGRNRSDFGRRVELQRRAHRAGRFEARPGIACEF